MKHYIFDIDGTLTPSRGRIDPEFETFFKSFINKNKVSLVTGSDRPKTLEQIGIDEQALEATPTFFCVYLLRHDVCFCASGRGIQQCLGFGQGQRG